VRTVHDSVENLGRTWSSIEALCSSLTEEEWKHSTALPGWNVQDNLSHLVDYESRAVGRPGPDHTPSDVDHTRNAIGESNEVGVDYRRSWPGEQVLAEFREVTAARLAQLRSFTDDDLARPVDTPIGPGTVADMLKLRVMDSWAHEQDIRTALHRPGHLEGPAVDEALGHFTGFLPYVIGKRAGAPDGARVVVEIAGHDPIAIEVVDGRARRTDTLPDEPAVRMRTDVATFAALVNGRLHPSGTDLGDRIEITGDQVLGRAIVDNLKVMV
jgi:uncharacterized protein (TIGR03083 family)